MYENLLAAYTQVRDELLAERDGSHWTGELSISALSTATAVSALSIYQARAERVGLIDSDAALRIQQLRFDGMQWLAERQNADGGWGDTSRSDSNIATTMLVRAALQLNGAPASPQNLLESADQYITLNGGVDGVRKRYGKDKTFAVPILANCAIAGMVPWRQVSPLPFELACLPPSVYRFLRLPVVSYAIPALVAIGLARFRNAPPWNPIRRLLRRWTASRSLAVLEKMQPASGGFLEATPLTSFVVMSLASAGEVEHPVVRKGAEFLCDSVRPCGGWPIDTDLATWVTTLSINALAAGDADVESLDCLDWLLSCQQQDVHPYTESPSGGWAWTNLSGGVPDADDTAGALLALSSIGRQHATKTKTIHSKSVHAAEAGVDWLLNLQNADGGWPTFCRGWGLLPFDRSGSDLTAHALRALHTWLVNFDQIHHDSALNRELRAADTLDAIEHGFEFLQKQQQSDGSWIPLWFGNQDHIHQWNPVYGTSRVLLAYRDLRRFDRAEVRRGVEWLVTAQSKDGSWGSTEETALAVEALLAEPGESADASVQNALNKGLQRLVWLIQHDEHREASPIGFYFANLWYYECLYPLIFTTSALGQALRKFNSQHQRPRPHLYAPTQGKQLAAASNA